MDIQIRSKGCKRMDPQLLREIDRMHAKICEALADPKCTAILYALRDGTITVNQLAETLDLPQATMSRHKSCVNAVL